LSRKEVSIFAIEILNTQTRLSLLSRKKRSTLPNACHICVSTKWQDFFC
jgi:hypothetical protein